MCEINIMVLKLNINPDIRPSLGGPDSGYVESPQPDPVDMDAYFEWADTQPDPSIHRYLRELARQRLRINTSPEIISVNRWSPRPESRPPWVAK